MKEKISKLNIWIIASLIILLTYLIFLVYPILSVFTQALIKDGKVTFEHFQTFFTNNYYLNTLLNSFKVSLVGTFFALIIGTLLAYLFNMYQFKGKRFLQILIIIASMSAPFVGAYSWILLLGRNGVVTKFLMTYLSFPQIDIYGFSGIVLVFTLQLFPLVFLYINGAFKNIDQSVLEAAESMGANAFDRFRKIIIPMITPTLLAAGLLVFMRAFSDFGTPMLIGEGYRTFPVLIYSEFISEVGGDAAFAAALSIISILIALTIFVLQRFISEKTSFTMNSLNTIEPKKVKSLPRLIIYILVYGIVFLAISPQLYLVYTSFLNTSGMVFVPGYSLNSYYEAFDRMGSSILNTIRIPFMALVIVIVFATFIAYLAVRKKNRITSLIDTLSMIPYIVPGTVLGIAFIASFNTGIANTGFLSITGTAFIMVVSLAIRRLPYTIRSSVASLQQISPSIEEAAESLGSSRINTFTRITIPMMLPGIISGGILSWVTMISELSTSVLLYTVSTRTMTVGIYTEVIRGNYGIAAALSTILMLLTVGSLLLFMRVSDSEDITL